MEVTTAQKMASYWQQEPPLGAYGPFKLYYEKQGKGKKGKGMNILPNTAPGRPWSQQPDRVKEGVIAAYLHLNPGKTEEDFNREREALVKAKYADRLAAAREAKKQAS